MHQRSARLRPGHAAPEELLANLLEASWSARNVEKKGDGAPRTLLQLMLCCANVVTLHDAIAVDLDQVARCSGYTRRSLEQIFKQALGESPSGWFMKIRLYGAWREIQCPGARVADVAMRWRFPHLGRFASYYRAAFGELPSGMLKRAKTGYRRDGH